MFSPLDFVCIEFMSVPSGVLRLLIYFPSLPLLCWKDGLEFYLVTGHKWSRVSRLVIRWCLRAKWDCGRCWVIGPHVDLPGSEGYRSSPSGNSCLYGHQGIFSPNVPWSVAQASCWFPLVSAPEPHRHQHRSSHIHTTHILGRLLTVLATKRGIATEYLKALGGRSIASDQNIIWFLHLMIGATALMLSRLLSTSLKPGVWCDAIKGFFELCKNVTCFCLLKARVGVKKPCPLHRSTKTVVGMSMMELCFLLFQM